MCSRITTKFSGFYIFYLKVRKSIGENSRMMNRLWKRMDAQSCGSGSQRIFILYSHGLFCN